MKLLPRFLHAAYFSAARFGSTMIEKTIIDLEQPPLDQSERTQATPAVARRAAALAGVLLIFVGAILGMSTFQADLSNPESRSLVTLEPVSEDIIDIQAFIDSQVLQGEKHIVIPPGRHYVKPQHHDGKTHLFFRNLRDIVIDGMDMAEIVCTKTTRAITLYNCKNVTLRGLVVDYDPLPYTQGEIVDMSDDKLKLTVSMISGYPKANSIIQQKNIEIYDSTTDELSTLTYYNVGVNVIDQDTVVVTKNAQYAALSQEKVGDIVVFYSANMQNQFPHAVFASDSSDLKFERVKVFASNMFGFLETRCNNSGYVDCSVDRRLPEDDIRERGHRRLRSTNADAFHSKQAAIGPKFNGVTARYNGDDGIAINGDYHIITKISKGPTNTLRIIGKNGKVPDLSEGDDVELVMYSGEKIPSAKIVSFDSQSTYELETAEKDFLSRQRFSGETQLTSFVDKVYMVTLDRSIDVPMGSLIASANRIGNGYRVEDCIVGPLRSRGLLLKAGDGIVTGNTVRDTWLSAIVVEPEYVWLEAGSGDNISITNNVIERSHDVGIKVTARGKLILQPSPSELIKVLTFISTLLF